MSSAATYETMSIPSGIKRLNDQYLNYLKYLNRELNQDADQHLENSIDLPGKDPTTVLEPNYARPVFDTPLSNHIKNLHLDTKKITLKMAPSVSPDPVSSSSGPSLLVTNTDASNAQSATPPPRPAKEIAEDDIGRQSPLRAMDYDSASYPPRPEYRLLSSTIAALSIEDDPEPQPDVLAFRPPTFCWAPAQSANPEASSISSEQQAEQDQQQLPQQEEYQAWTPPNAQNFGRFPVYSSHHQASSPAPATTATTATTMDQATQTPRSAPDATAEPAPASAPVSSGPIPPEQPASSTRSETNPATTGALPTTTPPSQPPPPVLPNTPFQPHPYQPFYISLGSPFAMAQYAYPTRQPYWFFYPGASPSAGPQYSNLNPQSPWYSGTAHYLTSPPPQVYTVEPAYIMPQQATYYPPASPQNGSPYYYYVPGAPTYYRT